MIILSVILLYSMNHFFQLHDWMSVTVVLLLGLLSVLLLFRYKVFLLQLLAFVVPLSIHVDVGNSAIDMPGEIICVLLTAFALYKSIKGDFLKKELLYHPITLLLIVDLVWMLLTGLTGMNPLVSMKRCVIRFIYLSAFYGFYLHLFRFDPRFISRIYLLQCLGMLLPILFATQFHYELGFTAIASQRASAPFYNDHTMYGAALVFFIPFLSVKIFDRFNKHKFLYIVLLAIFCCAAFLSYSRAAWASLILAVVVMLSLKHRSLLLLGIILLSCAALLYFSDQEFFRSKFLTTKEVSNSKELSGHVRSISNVSTDVSNKERINRWKCAVRMFMDKPILGFGPGTYQFFYGAYQQRSDLTTISTFNGMKGHAHSEYLNVLSESGLPGLILFTGLMLVVLRQLVVLIRSENNAYKNEAIFLLTALLTFYIHGFFNGFMEFEKIAMPVFMSYAAVTVLSTHKPSMPA